MSDLCNRWHFEIRYQLCQWDLVKAYCDYVSSQFPQLSDDINRYQGATLTGLNLPVRPLQAYLDRLKASVSAYGGCAEVTKIRDVWFKSRGNSVGTP